MYGEVKPIVRVLKLWVEGLDAFITQAPLTSWVALDYCSVNNCCHELSLSYELTIFVNHTWTVKHCECARGILRSRSNLFPSFYSQAELCSLLHELDTTCRLRVACILMAVLQG